MKITFCDLNGLAVIEPSIFIDNRGYFFESYNSDFFNNSILEKINFVQDNQSFSKKNVLRGMHFQMEPFAQGKLVRVISGKVYDVAVDLRKNSKTFLEWFGIELSGENNKQLWIPEGFAHGFVTLSDNAILNYKVTKPYNKYADNTLSYNDPEVGIDWPVSGKEIILSDKDKSGKSIRELDLI